MSASPSDDGKTYRHRTAVGTFDVRIPDEPAAPPVPCESCGAAVVPVMLRDRSDLDPDGPERRAWWELTWGDWVTIGEHTPQRCRLARSWLVVRLVPRLVAARG